MSDQVRPKVLVLDPDLDFLESVTQSAGGRDIDLIARSFQSTDRPGLEDLLLELYPDLVVINLDQESAEDFGACLTTIFSVPVPLPPVVMGTTSKDDLGYKQRAYALGIDDYMLRPFNSRELWFRLDVLLKTRRLQLQLDTSSRKLSQLNMSLADTNRKLEEIAVTDELTGLSNMRFMNQFLVRHFELLKRYERPFSVIMIDLDHFKQVNDRNDHLVGSATIRTIGQVIQSVTRNTDVKARYGGDEYIIALPETDAAGVKIIAERMRRAIEITDHIDSRGQTFQVTASIGCAAFSQERHRVYTDLVKEADFAMYWAKKQGRNRVVVYVPELKKEVADYDASQSSILSEIKKIKG